MKGKIVTYRYIIADTFRGAAYGTNDLKVAEEMAEIMECFVADVEASEWISMSGRMPLKDYSDRFGYEGENGGPPEEVVE